MCKHNIFDFFCSCCKVSRKLAFVEDELEVAEDRVKSGDAKISELEEELKVMLYLKNFF